MNCLKSLKSRTSEPVPSDEGLFYKIISVLFPIAIFMIVSPLIIMVLGTVISEVSKNSTEAASFFTENSTALSVAIMIIAKLGAALACISAFKKEKTVVIYKNVPAKRYILAVVAGISVALFWNLLFSYLGITSSSASYAEVAKRQFSLPILWGLILYGIVTPIAEECVFRGIVYNSLRRNFGLIVSIIMSALLFGIYHENLVQGAYGCIMGIVLAWIYERYGGLIYPIIFHGIANSMVYLCINITILKNNVLNIPVMMGMAIIMIVSICLIGSEKNSDITD